MTGIAYGLLALVASTPQLPRAPDFDSATETQVTQVMIQQRVIIRVPATNRAPPQRPVHWVERKAPKCVPLDTLAGASITQDDSVDLMLRGGQRLRAHLDDDCPALDYYSGFYIKPTADGQVCERRDTLHTRAGGQCKVVKFRTLVPDR